MPGPVAFGPVGSTAASSTRSSTKPLACDPLFGLSRLSTASRTSRVATSAHPTVVSPIRRSDAVVIGDEPMHRRVRRHGAVAPRFSPTTTSRSPRPIWAPLAAARWDDPAPVAATGSLAATVAARRGGQVTISVCDLVSVDSRLDLTGLRTGDSDGRRCRPVGRRLGVTSRCDVRRAGFGHVRRGDGDLRRGRCSTVHRLPRRIRPLPGRDLPR